VPIADKPDTGTRRCDFCEIRPTITEDAVWRGVIDRSMLVSKRGQVRGGEQMVGVDVGWDRGWEGRGTA
jgi:hypothetical protein